LCEKHPVSMSRAHQYRDESRRRMYRDQEATRRVLLACIHDQHLSPAQRREAQQRLDALSRDGSVTRLQGRCVLTGRGRGVLRRYGLSRLAFRRLARGGAIPGVLKASW